MSHTEMNLRTQAQGTYQNGQWVRTGYDVRGFVGTGTAIEVVGRPIDPTRKTPWGAPVETLWNTEAEAEEALARIKAGDEAGINWASYSND